MGRIYLILDQIEAALSPMSWVNARKYRARKARRNLLMAQKTDAKLEADEHALASAVARFSIDEVETEFVRVCDEISLEVNYDKTAMTNIIQETIKETDALASLIAPEPRPEMVQELHKEMLQLKDEAEGWFDKTEKFESFNIQLSDKKSLWNEELHRLDSFNMQALIGKIKSIEKKIAAYQADCSETLAHEKKHRAELEKSGVKAEELSEKDLSIGKFEKNFMEQKRAMDELRAKLKLLRDQSNSVFSGILKQMNLLVNQDKKAVSGILEQLKQFNYPSDKLKTLNARYAQLEKDVSGVLTRIGSDENSLAKYIQSADARAKRRK